MGVLTKRCHIQPAHLTIFYDYLSVDNAGSYPDRFSRSNGSDCRVVEAIETWMIDVVKDQIGCISNLQRADLAQAFEVMERTAA